MFSASHSDSTLSIERFEKIYHATYGPLFAFTCRYLKDQQAVKDVLQECYIRLWQKLDQVTDDDNLLPMLRVWVVNTTINMVRKNVQDMKRAYTWQQSQPQTGISDESLEAQDVLRQYRQAVDSLPTQQRQVYRLTREEGLSLQAAADQLQISIHTVKRHLNEALRTLRGNIPNHILTGILLLLELQSGA